MAGGLSKVSEITKTQSFQIIERKNNAQKAGQDNKDLPVLAQFATGKRGDFLRALFATHLIDETLTLTEKGRQLAKQTSITSFGMTEALYRVHSSSTQTFTEQQILMHLIKIINELGTVSVKSVECVGGYPLFELLTKNPEFITHFLISLKLDECDDEELVRGLLATPPDIDYRVMVERGDKTPLTKAELVSIGEALVEHLAKALQTSPNRIRETIVEPRVLFLGFTNLLTLYAKNGAFQITLSDQLFLKNITSFDDLYFEISPLLTTQEPAQLIPHSHSNDLYSTLIKVLTGNVFITDPEALDSKGALRCIGWMTKGGQLVSDTRKICNTFKAAKVGKRRWATTPALKATAAWINDHFPNDDISRLVYYFNTCILFPLVFENPKQQKIFRTQIPDLNFSSPTAPPLLKAIATLINQEDLPFSIQKAILDLICFVHLFSGETLEEGVAIEIGHFHLEQPIYQIFFTYTLAENKEKKVASISLPQNLKKNIQKLLAITSEAEAQVLSVFTPYLNRKTPFPPIDPKAHKKRIKALGIKPSALLKGGEKLFLSESPLCQLIGYSLLSVLLSSKQHRPIFCANLPRLLSSTKQSKRWLPLAKFHLGVNRLEYLSKDESPSLSWMYELINARCWSDAKTLVLLWKQEGESLDPFDLVKLVFFAISSMTKQSKSNSNQVILYLGKMVITPLEKSTQPLEIKNRKWRQKQFSEMIGFFIDHHELDLAIRFYHHLKGQKLIAHRGEIALCIIKSLVENKRLNEGFKFLLEEKEILLKQRDNTQLGAILNILISRLDDRQRCLLDPEFLISKNLGQKAIFMIQKSLIEAAINEKNFSRAWEDVLTLLATPIDINPLFFRFYKHVLDCFIKERRFDDYFDMISLAQKRNISPTFLLRSLSHALSQTPNTRGFSLLVRILSTQPIRVDLRLKRNVVSAMIKCLKAFESKRQKNEKLQSSLNEMDDVLSLLMPHLLTDVDDYKAICWLIYSHKLSLSANEQACLFWFQSIEAFFQQKEYEKGYHLLLDTGRLGFDRSPLSKTTYTPLLITLIQKWDKSPDHGKQLDALCLKLIEVCPQDLVKKTLTPFLIHIIEELIQKKRYAQALDFANRLYIRDPSAEPSLMKLVIPVIKIIDSLSIENIFIEFISLPHSLGEKIFHSCSTKDLIEEAFYSCILNTLKSPEITKEETRKIQSVISHSPHKFQRNTFALWTLLCNRMKEHHFPVAELINVYEIGNETCKFGKKLAHLNLLKPIIVMLKKENNPKIFTFLWLIDGPLLQEDGSWELIHFFLEAAISVAFSLKTISKVSSEQLLNAFKRAYMIFIQLSPQWAAEDEEDLTIEMVKKFYADDRLLYKVNSNIGVSQLDRFASLHILANEQKILIQNANSRKYLIFDELLLGYLHTLLKKGDYDLAESLLIILFSTHHTRSVWEQIPKICDLILPIAMRDKSWLETLSTFFTILTQIDTIQLNYAFYVEKFLSLKPQIWRTEFLFLTKQMLSQEVSSRSKYAGLVERVLIRAFQVPDQELRKSSTHTVLHGILSLYLVGEENLQFLQLYIYYSVMYHTQKKPYPEEANLVSDFGYSLLYFKLFFKNAKLRSKLDSFKQFTSTILIRELNNETNAAFNFIMMSCKLVACLYGSKNNRDPIFTTRKGKQFFGEIISSALPILFKDPKNSHLIQWGIYLIYIYSKAFDGKDFSKHIKRLLSKSHQMDELTGFLVKELGTTGKCAVVTLENFLITHSEINTLISRIQLRQPIQRYQINFLFSKVVKFLLFTSYSTTLIAQLIVAWTLREQDRKYMAECIKDLLIRFNKLHPKLCFSLFRVFWSTMFRVSLEDRDIFESLQLSTLSFLKEGLYDLFPKTYLIHARLLYKNLASNGIPPMYVLETFLNKGDLRFGQGYIEKYHNHELALISAYLNESHNLTKKFDFLAELNETGQCLKVKEALAELGEECLIETAHAL